MTSDEAGGVAITVRGPGRCTGCSFHVATQGHRDGCSGTAPVLPNADEAPFLQRIQAFRGARDMGGERG